MSLTATRPTEALSVVVTGGGALLGQGILRAIRRSSLNARVIAVDVSPLSAGLYWADEAYLVPAAASPDYLPAIARLLGQRQVDILLVGTDVELAVLAGAREELQAKFGTRVLVGHEEAIAIADDKLLTAHFMAERGFASPTSALGTDLLSIEALLRQHGFPVIVKPRVGARSYGVVKVWNRHDMERALSRIREGIVQECVGEDAHEYTASGLYFDGECQASVVMRRDLRDGNTYRAFTVDDPTLTTAVKQWTQALGAYGPANFQFRLDPFGAPKVFEINARFSGTTPLRALAGFNEVEMCVRKVLWGQPIMQPAIAPLCILRHWSETVVALNRPAAVLAI